MRAARRPPAISRTNAPTGRATAAPARDLRAGARVVGDARAIPLADESVDLCVSSPPYWRKRDYGHRRQLGREATPDAYVDALLTVVRDVRRVLKPAGSLFLNLGDTYRDRSLVGIPFLVEAAARADGWRVRNRIVWAKPNGVPSPHRDRLANRHEVLLHLTGSDDYYYDLEGLCEHLGTRAPGGDVWSIAPARHLGDHPAAYPEELAARVITLACPRQVCRRCGYARRRITEPTADLDPARQQARRALALAREHGLTEAHLAAVRATGISDAGKGARLQVRNAPEVRRLAAEAKRALGGYFREFTFGRRRTTGATACSCKRGWHPGLVLDVFAGTCTTLQAAAALGRWSVGVDLNWGVPPPRKRGGTRKRG